MLLINSYVTMLISLIPVQMSIPLISKVKQKYTLYILLIILIFHTSGNIGIS